MNSHIIYIGSTLSQNSSAEERQLFTEKFYHGKIILEESGCSDTKVCEHIHSLPQKPTFYQLQNIGLATPDELNKNLLEILYPSDNKITNFHHNISLSKKKSMVTASPLTNSPPIVSWTKKFFDNSTSSTSSTLTTHFTSSLSSFFGQFTITQIQSIQDSPWDMDVLSIHLTGMDHSCKLLQQLLLISKPKVVVASFNPAFPPPVFYNQFHSSKSNKFLWGGCSLTALHRYNNLGKMFLTMFSALRNSITFNCFKWKDSRHSLFERNILHSLWEFQKNEKFGIWEYIKCYFVLRLFPQRLVWQR